MRILSKLDLRNNQVVKGVQYEGVESQGDFFSIYQQVCHYLNQNINPNFEIILNDVTASLYDVYSGRTNIQQILANKSFHLPHIVSGGIKTLTDITQLLQMGADRVMVNTSLISNLDLLDQIINSYGAQLVIPTLETKLIDNDYYIYTNYGREETNIKLTDWITQLYQKGVIEILIISIDADGLMGGHDQDLLLHLKDFFQRQKINLSVLYGGGINDLNSTIDECQSNFNFINGLCISTYFYQQIKQKSFEFDFSKNLNKNSKSEENKYSMIEKEFLNEMNENKINENEINGINSKKQNENSNALNVKIENFNFQNEKNQSKHIYFLKYLTGNAKSVYQYLNKNHYQIILVDRLREIPEHGLLCISGHYNSYYLLKKIQQAGDFLDLKQRLKTEKLKYFGICAGFQILFDQVCNEFDQQEITEGLGIIHAKDYSFGHNRKPHIGFFQYDSQNVFFCHSYYIKNKITQDFLNFYHQNHIFGTQFHPENSPEFMLPF